MDEMFQRLENRIKKLINQHQELKKVNYELHQGKHVLAREKESLQTKQLKAVSQIESLVSKLKAIEKMP